MADPFATLAESPIGSDIFAVCALLVISTAVLLILRHFLPIRTTPAYLLVPIFFALALPASIIVLVPVDLASSAGTDSGTRGIRLLEPVLRVSWRISYWLTFFLTWFILPLLGEYVDSGYLSPKDRFLYSLRRNARYQLIVLGSGAAGLVYFFIQSGASATSFKALVMALAYCWGLILAIYLMGHGLVAVPRKIIRNANTGERLKRLQAKAPKIHDSLDESIEEMVELETQVAQLRQGKNLVSRDLQEWVEELADMSGLPETRLPSRAPLPRTSSAAIPTVITEQYLADLTRRFKRERHKRARFLEEWDFIILEAARLQAILDSSASKRLIFTTSSAPSTIVSRLTLLTPYTRYLLYTQILPLLRYGLGSFLALASACIIWCELIKSTAPKLSIISLTIVHHPTSSRGQIGFGGQVIAAAWLLYMCTAALTSISDAKVWGNRALVRRNTYGESACWYAMQTAKLTIPLAYNFVTFLPKMLYQSTTFYHFLGRLLDSTKLVEGFDLVFPFFILFSVFASLFNLYGKIKRCFGFGLLDPTSDDDDDEPDAYGSGTWREGRDLIERELSGNASLPPFPASPTSASPGTASPARRPPGRAQPTLWIPPAAAAPTGASNTSLERTAQRRALAARLRDEERADERDPGFFGDFGRRIRNTLDTADAPRWMREGLKKPRWLAADEGHDGEDGAGQETGGNGLGRWFGGRREGGVRL